MIINVKVNNFEVLYTPDKNLYITHQDFMISCKIYTENEFVLYSDLKTELYDIEAEEKLKTVINRIQDNLLMFADTEEFNVVFEIIRDLKEFIVFLEEE